MTTIIVKILLQALIFMMPAIEQWMRGMLASPPPPEVPHELHNIVSQMLPAQSESEKVARQLASEQAGSNVSTNSRPGGTPPI